MKLKLEAKAVVPLGTINKFMSHINEQELTEDDPDTGDDNSELTLEIEYPPLNYDGNFYWNEMSYHRLTQTLTCWSYDYYADGEWNW